MRVFFGKKGKTKIKRKIMKVMWRAEKEAWVDLRSVRKLTRLSPAKAGVLANCDDEMIKAWRMAARLRK